MGKIKLLLVRHGQSIANKLDIVGGAMDFDLTLKGKSQAKKVAKRLAKEYKIDRIYSSNLKRAYKTAREIAKAQGIAEKDIIINENLREMGFGKCEKLTFSQCEKLYKEKFDVWRNVNIYPTGFPEQEEIESVLERYKKAVLDIIADAKEGETICIASHSVAMKTFICSIKYPNLRDDFKKLKKLDNTGIFELNYDIATGKFEIIKDADATHLEK